MKIASYIDHTLLKPTASADELKKLCAEAAEYTFASVCVNPCNVADAKAMLKDTPVKICTVIGFPLGAGKTETKVFEAKEALKDGCDEFDMVINIGKLKDKDYDFVRADIAAVKEAIGDKTLKVIIETGLLEDDEKVIVSKLCLEAKADFVKTCTGFAKGSATVEDIALIKKTVGNNSFIKASGGVRDLASALALIEAGADRIGASAGVSIAEEEAKA